MATKQRYGIAANGPHKGEHRGLPARRILTTARTILADLTRAILCKILQQAQEDLARPERSTSASSMRKTNASASGKTYENKASGNRGGGMTIFKDGWNRLQQQESSRRP